ncbi:MAG: hypothetical protein HGB26_03340 [Desulfobulbaceae bacterium]|nr:hypothetical protein [Desulfobulbaceae bacterium]
MFYWSHRGIHIVLSDEEELMLVQELGKDPMERIRYHTSQKVRKVIEQRICRYFKESLYADTEAFKRRFVFRTCYGEVAQKMFPIMLEAYGRITRRATIGQWGVTSPLDDVVEEIMYAETEEVLQITLFERSRVPWASPLVSGHISLPALSIEKLAGTVDNFFVASDTVSIKFHRDFVRVSVLDKQGMPNNRIDPVKE